MEIVSIVIGSVIEGLINPIKKNLGYLISYQKNVSDMNTKINELNDRRKDVETQMNWNKSNNLEIPSRVHGWLKDVRDIKTLAESFPSDHVGCCNLKVRYTFGKKALKMIQDINSLIDEASTIKWTDHAIPLGKVDNMKASTSTSTPLSQQDDFQSRKPTFTKALKALESDHNSHMVALCGMGGVGKTTMMEKLKKVVIEKKMFDFIIEATIGGKPDTFAIQQVVAEFLGVDLAERDKTTRAIKLRNCFKTHSKEGKKFLMVLDDVWEFVDLNDIGLSPLPNQGVNFKILLTSRNRDVCIKMGVEVDSILNVEVLTTEEAQTFFLQFARISKDVDLHKIGDAIAIRCHGLPIAIKTIAYTLKGKSKDVWEDALSKLKNNHLDEDLHQIFEMSYNNLQDEETRSTLLLCGLFRKDLDTPKEDLVRYGWGLSLFSHVKTISEARNRLSTHIERLIAANLLIKSEDVWRVKMHDLVRAFVLRMCSEGEHASIVGTMSNWPTKHTSESWKMISLTCTGMSQFPRDCKYPNLLLLKLMNGDQSLLFHDEFYQEMGKLEVLAYESMRCPIPLRSLRCSTNLRTLCFHDCRKKIDFPHIGDLFNLEVLSFAHCGIRKLPSAIGNLKKLRLLDLTSCIDPCIENGVLKSLVKLEELYMRQSRFTTGFTKAAFEFTNSKEKVNNLSGINGDELATCSKNLVALEIEFLDSNALPTGMSFEQLKRFKISLGCSLGREGYKYHHSYENTLMLVTNKDRLMEFRIDELFKETSVLHIQVDDVRDGLVKSFNPHPSFYNLRVLKVNKCVKLRYLFSDRVANGLTKLERLTVSSCLILETLFDSEDSGCEAIKFRALKFLFLDGLPKLTRCFNNVKTIKLPQLEELALISLPNFTSIYPSQESTSSVSNDASATQPFLNKEIVVPRLKKMTICNMKNLKEIWPSTNGEKLSVSLLKEIEVAECQRLVNLFPSNPMSSLLHHLEKLRVINCRSIEVLFNIDLGRVGEINEEGNTKLKCIQISGLSKLKEIWRVKYENASNDHYIMGFEALEKIEIFGCKNLNRVFPPTIKFDMEVTINDENWLGKLIELRKINKL